MDTIVNIDVPDLEPAVEFYRSAFGLKLSRILDDDVAELVGASSRIYLLKNRAGSTPTKSAETTRTYARHWTPVHMDFVVDKLPSATQRVIEAGAIRESDTVEWRESKCITFSDPFGHGFCLIEFAREAYSDQDT